MDQNSVALQQLHRQLRLLNTWLLGFGIVLVVALAVIGILLFKLISFTHNAQTKLETLESQTKQTLNIKQQLCGSGAAGPLLKSENYVCQ